MRVDKGLEFYNRSMKSWLEKNAIEIYSIHKEGKSVVAERFIRTLKNNIYKYMTSISKNVYIDKLDDIVNKYNNTYRKTSKMKPIDVKPSMYIDFNKENNKEGPTFKVGDHVKISKYKNIFAKGYIPNWSEEVFVIQKVKNTVLWHMLLMILIKKKLLERFTKKIAKPNLKEFRVEKIIKRKGDKLSVKWKGCDRFFNSWIDKKDE